MSAAGRGAPRIAQDLYPTPLYAVTAIMERIHTDRVESSCEPCRGHDAIYNLLPGRKYWAEISKGVDYLTTPFPVVDLIVTNPPFSLALEFLDKSIWESKTCIYLLRLNFLGSQKRKPFWQEYPLTHLYVLSTRPSFHSARSDATEYAWFVWDRAGLMKDEPGIYVI